jgi:hypothetical protein
MLDKRFDGLFEWDGMADGMLQSGMESGVTQSCPALDQLLGKSGLGGV